MIITERRAQIIKITEYRDNCVWKTKMIGEIWVRDDLTREQENDIAKANGGDYLGSLPTSEMRKGYDVCYRSRIVNHDH